MPLEEPVPSVVVDGNDAAAVHAVLTEAVARAAKGDGPTLVEAYTYRMGAHTTSDDPTRYRSAAEEEVWRRRDPIDRLRQAVTRARRPRPSPRQAAPPRTRHPG